MSQIPDLDGIVDIRLSREPVLIFGTGDSAANLRTSIWVKQKYPNALVYARTNDRSNFALAVGGEHGIKNISITQLVEQYMPERWMI